MQEQKKPIQGLLLSLICFLLLVFASCVSVSTKKTDPDTTEKGTWEVEEGIQIQYFARGSGRKILVLHGGPGMPMEEPWTGANLLAGKYRFYYYHQRGCGLSTRPVEKFATNNYQANVKELDKKLGLDTQLKDIEQIRLILNEKKLIIIGHSFGGFLATMYALKYPERVKKLILIAPAEVLKMPQEGSGLYGIVEQYLENDPLLPEFRDFLRRYFDYSTIFSRDEIYLQDLSNEFIIYWDAARKNTGLETASAPYNKKSTGGWVTPAIFFSLGMRYDYTPQLHKIKCPVLILHGEKDLIPVTSVKDYANNLTHNRLEIIPGAGHFLFEDDPERFAELVSGFIK